MKIGLIDVDGHNFPNLPLMKLSAWHKQNGDQVEWYAPMSEHMDIVYMSKVFSFTPDYQYHINADKVIKEGSGYCIESVNGKEIYNKARHHDLPYKVEHIYPDYLIYPDKTKGTAYGFLTRGCPRGCEFCHVKCKEGITSNKVADLSEFWRGQPNIELMDPNLLACKDHKELLLQIINSKANVNMNQGIDCRMLTDENIDLLKQIKLSKIHFAFDQIKDADRIISKLKQYKDATNCDMRKTIVYILTNFDTTFEQDLERVYLIREIGMSPYIMIYDKREADQNVKDLARWVNNRFIWYKDLKAKFEDYRASDKDNKQIENQIELLDFIGGLT